MKKFNFLIFLIIINFLYFNSFSENSMNNEDYRYMHYLNYQERYLQKDLSKGFTETPPPVSPVRQVAEFEKMSGVLIRYPFGIPYSLIAEMSKDINVVTIVANQSEVNTVTQLYNSNGVNTSNCSFLIAPSNSYWTRDYGPMFIFDGNNNFGVVDFIYNRPRPNDDEIPIKYAQMYNYTLYGMPIIHTGGNYMCDGFSNGFSTTLVYEENPTLTHLQVNTKMYEYLGINNYFVVEDPNNTYIDHIDCWGKLLAPNKILIRSVPTSHPQYNAIESVANYFRNQISAYGTPYKVYRVYTPNNEPYTNSLILNNKVFVPLMGNSNDNAALEAYRNAMPGYKVMGFLNSSYSTGWVSTDALHCRTHELADAGMLYIKHIPLINEQNYAQQYEINAEIIPYSGQALYSDSLLLYYSINNSPYNSVNLVSSGKNSYAAYIPITAPGDTVKYYIYAADHSGRNAKYPYMGDKDPFVFWSSSVNINSLNTNNFQLNIIPNPFNPCTTINYQLKNKGIVDISIMNIKGEIVKKISKGMQDVGEYQVKFDANNMSSGIYFCNISVNGKLSASEKMLLIK